MRAWYGRSSWAGGAGVSLFYQIQKIKYILSCFVVQIYIYISTREKERNCSSNCSSNCILLWFNLSTSRSGRLRLCCAQQRARETPMASLWFNLSQRLRRLRRLRSSVLLFLFLRFSIATHYHYHYHYHYHFSLSTLFCNSTTFYLLSTSHTTLTTHLLSRSYIEALITITHSTYH